MDWGLGIRPNGDWGLGIGPNPQSPIPNPQSPFIILYKLILKKMINLLNLTIINRLNFLNSSISLMSNNIQFPF